MTKISEFPAASTLTGAELVPLGQGSSTVRSTVDGIAQYVTSTYQPATGGSQPQNGAKVITDYWLSGDGSNWGSARTKMVNAAGNGGGCCYPPISGGYGYSSAFQPKERQYHYGLNAPMYDSDSTSAMTNAQYALAGYSSTAMVFYGDTTAGRGAEFDHMMWVGLGDEASTVLNCFDFGAPGGGERSVGVHNSQMMGFSGAVLCGHMWVIEAFKNFVSRCGYYVRPVSGGNTDGAAAVGGNQNCQALDVKFGLGGYVYFTYHHAYDFSGAKQHGQVAISNQRIERCGATFGQPENDRDPGASFIYATNLSVLNLTSISTDANSGPDIKFVGVSTENSVNNVQGSDLTLKRGGQGNQVDTDLPAIWLDRCQRVQLRGAITFGRAADSGGTITRTAPQHAVWMNRAYRTTWDGTAELGGSGTNTAANLYQNMPAASTASGTQENNYQSYVRDPAYNAWAPIAMGT